MRSELRKADREKRLRKYQENGGIPTRVSVSQCREMRQQYRNPRKTHQDIADSFNIGTSTVSRHLNGRCSHDIEETGEPVSVRDCLENVEMTNGLSVNQCREIQEQYRQPGATQKAIADNFSVHQSTVSRHLNGRCTHDTEPIDTGFLKRHRISDEECQVIRRQYEKSGTTQRDIADRFNLSTAAVNHHINGKCSHD